MVRLHPRPQERSNMKHFVLNDNIGYIEKIRHDGDDLSIVNSARISFMKESKEFSEKDEKLIKYLIRNNHTSPFEYPIISFEVKCPIFVARQWMRHRTFSYNEVSRRYTSEQIEFYFPQYLRTQDKINKQSSADFADYGDYLDKMKAVTYLANSLYEQMIDDNIAREIARIILPQNLYTKFIVTGNLHNWLHFVELRIKPQAQYEIMVYAEKVLEELEQGNPITIKYWREKIGL